MSRRFRCSGVVLMLLAILAQPVLAAGSLCSLGHGSPPGIEMMNMSSDHSMHMQHSMEANRMGSHLHPLTNSGDHACCDSATCDMPECSVHIMGLTGFSVTVPVINAGSAVSAMISSDHLSPADSLYRPPILA